MLPVHKGIEMEKLTYRVKPGFRHGRDNEYGPGDTVELTEREASGFLDKLELVEGAPKPAAKKTATKDK